MNPNMDELHCAMSNCDYGAMIPELQEIVLELTGENDGADWHWIVKLNDGTYAYIHGGCDNTGWDCQAGLDVHKATTEEGALMLVGQNERRIFEDMILAGVKQRNNG